MDFPRDLTVSVSLPNDPSGYRHHECPDCHGFFKVKPGTGLPTSDIHCPYCPCKGHASQFLTAEMMEYGRALLTKKVMEQVIDPWRHEMEQIFQPSRGPLRITLETSRSETPEPFLRMSQEKLETFHTCYNCGLEFAIYGVFSRCPDCAGINAYGIFKDSIVQRFRMLAAVPTDSDQSNTAVEDALGGSIGAFDALGKELRRRYPAIFPERPKNLFQNFFELEKIIKSSLGIDLSTTCKEVDHTRLMFQVRHLHEHNLGVVDDEFITKLPKHRKLKGRKYPLTREDVLKFMEQLVDIVQVIESALSK